MADKEKASPLRGEARASGAGELLCSVASCSSSESEGGGGSCSAESEGSGEGSGLASRAREGDLLPIGGGTEAEPYGACKEGEGRSEGANRAEHGSRARERRGERRGGSRPPQSGSVGGREAEALSEGLQLLSVHPAAALLFPLKRRGEREKVGAL